MKDIWVDPKAHARYEALLEQIEDIFKVPPAIARAEPHVFQGWFYGQQKRAAHLKIEAAMMFLTFTKAP